MPEEIALHNPLLDGPFTRVLLELRWGDMDAYGHVNNVTQLRLLEEARVRAFGSPTADRDVAVIDGPGGPLVTNYGQTIPPVFRNAAAGADILVTAHQIDYRAQINYREGPIAVDVVISKVSPVVITVGYVIGEPDGSAVYSVAETDVAFVDHATGRARRLTDDEIALLEPLVSTRLKLKKR